MNKNEIEQEKKKIDGYKYWELAYLWRHCSAGHPYFVSGPLYRHLERRFSGLGGMTKEMSKRIGWDRHAHIEIDKEIDREA
jgi:hypothetical protein